MDGTRSAAELARRIERAEAEQLARTGPPGPSAAREVAGGLAVLKTRGSPFSMALAMGLAGPVSAEDVDEVEDHLEQAGAGVQVVVAAPADPSLAAELGRRGYRLERFHQVWWRAPRPLPDPPAAVEARPILAREESAWVHAFALAFLGRPPASPALATALRGMIRAEGNVCFAALDHDEVVAVAIASTHGGVATLSGAVTAAAACRARWSGRGSPGRRSGAATWPLQPPTPAAPRSARSSGPASAAPTRAR